MHYLYAIGPNGGIDSDYFKDPTTVDASAILHDTRHLLRKFLIIPAASQH
jgi:hypothetical protein